MNIHRFDDFRNFDWKEAHANVACIHSPLSCFQFKRGCRFDFKKFTYVAIMSLALFHCFLSEAEARRPCSIAFLLPCRFCVHWFSADVKWLITISYNHNKRSTKVSFIFRFLLILLELKLFIRKHKVSKKTWLKGGKRENREEKENTRVEKGKTEKEKENAGQQRRENKGQ